MKEHEPESKQDTQVAEDKSAENAIEAMRVTTDRAIELLRLTNDIEAPPGESYKAGRELTGLESQARDSALRALIRAFGSNIERKST